MVFVLQREGSTNSVELSHARVIGRMELDWSCSAISRNHASIEIVKDKPVIICEHENGITIKDGENKITLTKGQKYPLRVDFKILFGMESGTNTWFNVTTDPPPLQTRAHARKQERSFDCIAIDKPTETHKSPVHDNKKDANNNNGRQEESKQRKSCIMGANCRIKTPNHFAQTAHKGDEDFVVVRYKQARPGAPPCMYGTKCYRSNASHWENFNH